MSLDSYWDEPEPAPEPASASASEQEDEEALDYVETEIIRFDPSKENTNELLSSLKKLQVNGEYTDFRIKCHADIYKVHKVIICPRSPFFRVMFENDTKERDVAEVDLSEHDPIAVLLMIYFFYNLDYPAVGLHGNLYNEATNSSSNLSHHCRLYALADFCQVGSLKTLAVSKFKREAEKHWNDPDFFEAVQIVYSATSSSDRALRDAVVNVMMEHLTLLDRQEFKDLVKEIDLAYELLMEMHGTSEPGTSEPGGTPAFKRGKCINCRGKKVCLSCEKCTVCGFGSSAELGHEGVRREIAGMWP